MPKNIGLEEFRAALADNRQHIALALVKKVAVLSDRSAMRVQVSMLPEELEIIATMSWDSTGPEAGMFDLPVINDLVLIALVDGDPDQAYVIRRLTSKEDKIPLKAVDGHLVLQAKEGKEVHLKGDKVYLGTRNSDPTEPLVLGTQLQTLLSYILGELATHTHTSGPPGVLTTPPLNAANFTTKKTSPVDDGAILSDVAFTEKGS